MEAWYCLQLIQGKLGCNKASCSLFSALALTATFRPAKLLQSKCLGQRPEPDKKPLIECRLKINF